MRKTLLSLTLVAASALGLAGTATHASAATLSVAAASLVQPVRWGGDWRRDEWRDREWRRHEHWEHWRRHAAWERWHEARGW